jgi:all-trans-retinol dehydrogenase (NAD+)
LNNFEYDESWDWTKEVVLITGGSNGIGAEMVRRFSKRGIKIVIWDVVSPSPDLLGA